MTSFMITFFSLLAGFNGIGFASSAFCQELDLQEIGEPLTYSRESLIESAKNDRYFLYYQKRNVRIVLVQDYFLLSTSTGEVSHVHHHLVLNRGADGAKQFTILQEGNFSDKGDLFIHLITHYDYGDSDAVLIEVELSPLMIPKTAPSEPPEEPHLLTIDFDQYEKWKQRLQTIRNELDQKLIFGLPEEHTLVFLIDGSPSTSARMNGLATNLDYAVDQMALTLPLLNADQKFVIGIFSSKDPAYFNEGKPLYATAKNVQRAIQFLEANRNYAAGATEDCDRALVQLTQKFKADAVYIFSDFVFSFWDYAQLPGTFARLGAKVYLKGMKRTLMENMQKTLHGYSQGKILDPTFTFKNSFEELKALKHELEEMKTKTSGASFFSK